MKKALLATCYVHVDSTVLNILRVKLYMIILHSYNVLRHIDRHIGLVLKRDASREIDSHAFGRFNSRCDTSSPPEYVTHSIPINVRCVRW